MAESCNVAFGRYLRVLRQRRGLSLEEISTLSRTFAEPVDKGYLSRCENGRQSLALSKMIALSRIYELPSEVLLEHLELDLELDRVGGPVTEGKTFEELTNLGVAALRRGTRWDAYAYFRDATPIAANSPLMEGFERPAEQIRCSWMNFSTVAAELGRTVLALRELNTILDSDELSGEYGALLLERIALCYLKQRQLERAVLFADRAVNQARESGSIRYLGYTLSSRARLAGEQNDRIRALELYQEAFKAHSDAGRQPERATTLQNMASIYIDVGNFNAARRALAASERLAAPLRQQRTQALIRLLLGVIDEAEGKPSSAARRWREAISIANELRDRLLRFQAEFLLYKQALTQGNEDLASSFERRLRKLSPWIPANVTELAEFRNLYASRAKPKKYCVSRGQQP